MYIFIRYESFLTKNIFFLILSDEDWRIEFATLYIKLYRICSVIHTSNITRHILRSL